jgi:hypothetical protein
MSSDKPQKISIGFHGGQVLVARVSASELQGLRDVLGRGEGWHQMAAEEGTIDLDPKRVDYLLIDSDEHRIGF